MRALILRFSSLGDVLQGQLVPAALKSQHPQMRVDWLSKSEFAPLLRANRDIDQVHAFDPRSGLSGLLRLAWQLRALGYTHLYDAHNNLRSHLLCWILRLPGRGRPARFVRRSKERWKRFLLFRLRINTFPRPFRGQESYLAPLAAWGVSAPPQASAARLTFDCPSTLPAPYVALAPSAAWENKRWPMEYWARLLQLLPDTNFVLLGGPKDHFCAQLAASSPGNTRNLAGQCDLLQSAGVVAQAQALVANDTGWLHLADVLGKNSLALIGPTAFGYPRHPKSQVLEVQLTCKPCSKDGRDPCRNRVYQKCLRDVLPESVAAALQKLLK